MPEGSQPQTLRERVARLLRLNNSPHEIALGVAIGVFIGVTPLYGLHTLMVIAAAFFVKRVNKIAMLLGTSISTTPTVPLITWAGYSLGRLILGDHYPPLVWEMFKDIFHNGFQGAYQMIRSLYAPLFLGSVVLGMFLAPVFYFLVFRAVLYWQRGGSRSVDKT